MPWYFFYNVSMDTGKNKQGMVPKDVEALLAEIDGMGHDMYAEIIVQREEGYWDLDPDTKGQSYDRPRIWVVDKPEIREPDIPKRETAEKKLGDVYDHSEWYILKYRAGGVLGLPQLDEKLKDWVDERIEEISFLAARKKNQNQWNPQDERKLEQALTDFLYLRKHLSRKSRLNLWIRTHPVGTILIGAAFLISVIGAYFLLIS